MKYEYLMSIMVLAAPSVAYLSPSKGGHTLSLSVRSPKVGLAGNGDDTAPLEGDYASVGLYVSHGIFVVIHILLLFSSCVSSRGTSKS